MMSYLPVCGINKENFRQVEETTQSFLNSIDEILSENKFLLGDIPGLGDYSLFGFISGFLYHDPHTIGFIEKRNFRRSWT